VVPPGPSTIGTRSACGDVSGSAAPLLALLRRASELTNRATEVVLVPLTIFFFLVVFVAVLSRYLLNAAIVESIELTRLSFNWACFLGAAVAVQRMAHVRVTFLVTRAGPRVQALVLLLVYLVMLTLFVLMIVQGWALYERVRYTFFPALGWSQGLLYLSLPVSGAVMSVHAIYGAVANACHLLGIAGDEPRPGALDAPPVPAVAGDERR
jgi:TRAP-type transport system small permease protein